MGEELQRNQGWELQTGTRASQSHTAKEKPPHLQFASSWALVHASGQCCSHRKQGGSPGASQGYNDRWCSTSPEHLAKITELWWAGTPHRHLLPCHSWNSSFGTTVGMFMGIMVMGRSCSLAIPTPAPCSPYTPAQIPKVSHTRGSAHSNTPTAVGRTMISIYFVSYTSIF